MTAKNTRLGRGLCALLFSLCLAGCGGGGGDAPTTSYSLPSVINAVPAQQ